MTATYNNKTYKKDDCFTLTDDILPGKIYIITKIVGRNTESLELNYKEVKPGVRIKTRNKIFNLTEIKTISLSDCNVTIKGAGRRLKIVFISSESDSDSYIDKLNRMKRYIIKIDKSFSPERNEILSTLDKETQVLYAKRTTGATHNSRIVLTNGLETVRENITLQNFDISEIIRIENNLMKIYDVEGVSHKIIYIGNEGDLPTEVTKYNNLVTESIVSNIYDIKESNKNVLLICDYDFIKALNHDIVKDFFTQLRYRDYIITGKKESIFIGPPEATQEDTKRAISEADGSSLGGGAIKFYKFKKLKLRYK
jgi:hypothetical protein